MSNNAVFFDRDGTLVDDPGYLSHPDQVELLDGVAEALKQLQRLGYQVVVATNQSGVARGIVSEEMLDQIHERLQELLSKEAVSLDGIYCCPFHPDGVIPKYRKESDWRKPNPGMLLAASAEMDIDLSRSWMVGSSDRDIEAGRRAGCRTILVKGYDSEHGDPESSRPDYVAGNVKEAVGIIQTHRRPEAHDDAPPASAPPDEPASAATAPSLEPQEANDMPEPPQVQTAAAPDEPATSGARTEHLLETILEQIKRMQKTDMYGEFSFLRMLAGIIQVFVPFCLLIALWLLMSSDGQDDRVLVALGFASVLQLMAVTFYIMQGRR